MRSCSLLLRCASATSALLTLCVASLCSVSVSSGVFIHIAERIRTVRLSTIRKLKPYVSQQRMLPVLCHKVICIAILLHNTVTEVLNCVKHASIGCYETYKLLLLTIELVALHCCITDSVFTTSQALSSKYYRCISALNMYYMLTCLFCSA